MERATYFRIQLKVLRDANKSIIAADVLVVPGIDSFQATITISVVDWVIAS